MSGATAEALHHDSHRRLLASAAAPSVGLGEVDAIIVPTARTAAHLQSAVELAAKLRCTLVTLHSQRSSAARLQAMADANCVDTVAVDMRFVRADVLPNFRTTSLLASTPFARGKDTSSKRNLGLLLARLAGWQRVVFVDDDIRIADAQHLTDAVRLLHRFDGVGLTIAGFPDNSVVCHAHRKTGGDQDTFLGGGALAVNTSACDSFFPDVYNEDWFFLLDDTHLRPVATTRGVAFQRRFDPFATEDRARSEEFGDCLAEGLFYLLDQGKQVQDANVEHWRAFLEDRRRFISDILGRVDRADLEPAERSRIKSALRAARERCSLITPELCVHYLTAWRVDRARWRHHLDTHASMVRRIGAPDIDNALAVLGFDRRQSRFLVRT
ncbi:MAG TPA: hypothetical protein VL652_37020 [Kutzneria sp.]|nr:hypothetical protein [Kutzneria sp.]